MKINFEHHNPLGKNDYLSIQHLERYRFAVQQIKPDSYILDIASGAGYGSAILHQSGHKVVGVDYDPQLVSFAKSMWDGPNFMAGDALALPFEDATFDAVVTFETIEHVSNGDEFLQEMRRVLKPGGLLICSTPNIEYTAHPAFHLKEYRPEEFYNLIETYFQNSIRMGQYFLPEDRAADKIKFRRSKLISILNPTGIPKLLKWLLMKSQNAKQALPSEKNPAIELPPANEIYGVAPYRGSKYERIMISMGTKNN